MAILTIVFLPTSASYAQFWEAVKGIAKGVGSAMLENYIDNNSSYSNEVKQSMKNDLNTINNAINTNQNAANATRDAYHGNYTGAVIQGTQTIMNAAGNYNYDTYLNSANQINNANREYKQDVQNGMNRQEALDKRNTTIGYSAAESAIELQDRIAQKRLEEARRQRELEQQSWKEDNYYSESNYETNTEVTISETKTENEFQDIFETLWQKVIDEDENSNNRMDARSVSETELKKNRELNSYAHILTKDDFISFLTDEGTRIYLGIEEDTEIEIDENGRIMETKTGGTHLFYNNTYSDQEIRLNCNRVSIKVKYVDEDTEQNITDACYIIFPAKAYGELKWSDVFFNLSDTKLIESIKVCFIETQIR